MSHSICSLFSVGYPGALSVSSLEAIWINKTIEASTVLFSLKGSLKSCFDIVPLIKLRCYQIIHINQARHLVPRQLQLCCVTFILTIAVPQLLAAVCTLATAVPVIIAAAMIVGGWLLPRPLQ